VGRTIATRRGLVFADGGGKDEIAARELKAQGMRLRPVDISKALKIGRATVYPVLAAEQIAAPSSLEG
jgi:hypothetical protein